jgi:hypothetical protein
MLDYKVSINVTVLSKNLHARTEERDLKPEHLNANQEC